MTGRILVATGMLLLLALGIGLLLDYVVEQRRKRRRREMGRSRRRFIVRARPVALVRERQEEPAIAREVLCARCSMAAAPSPLSEVGGAHLRP